MSDKLRDKIEALLENPPIDDTDGNDVLADAILDLIRESITLEWDKHSDEQEWYAVLPEVDGDPLERGYMILPRQSHFVLFDGFGARKRAMGTFVLAGEAKEFAQTVHAKRAFSALGE